MNARKLRRIIGTVMLVVGVSILVLALIMIITDADIATNTNVNIFLYSSVAVNTVGVMLIRSSKKDKGDK